MVSPIENGWFSTLVMVGFPGVKLANPSRSHLDVPAEVQSLASKQLAHTMLAPSR